MNKETFAYKAAAEMVDFVKNNYTHANNLPSIEFYFKNSKGDDLKIKYILKEHSFETKGLPTSKFVLNDTFIETNEDIHSISMICSIYFCKLSQGTPWCTSDEKPITDYYFTELVEKFYKTLHYIYGDNDYEYKTIINN